MIQLKWENNKKHKPQIKRLTTLLHQKNVAFFKLIRIHPFEGDTPANIVLMQIELVSELEDIYKKKKDIQSLITFNTKLIQFLKKFLKKQNNGRMLKYI